MVRLWGADRGKEGGMWVEGMGRRAEKDDCNEERWHRSMRRLKNSRLF